MHVTYINYVQSVALYQWLKYTSNFLRSCKNVTRREPTKQLKSMMDKLDMQKCDPVGQKSSLSQNI